MPRRTVCLLLALAACGGKPPAAKPSPGPAPASQPAPRATPTLPPGVPDTPVGRELAWVLDVINRRQGKVERAEIEAHFHPSFLKEVPADKAIVVFGQLGQGLAPVEVGLVEAKGEQLGARAKTKAGDVRILIALDKGSGQIAALLFRPAELESGPKLQTFDEALAAAPKIAPRAQLLVAEVDKGKCRPLHQLGADEPLAIGSTFKLYVLLGLVDRIVAGKLGWDTPLAIRDDWKSLPSGTMQDDPPGKTFPVRTFAEQMISISDNTAADHLLYTVGRKNVEAAVKSSRHQKPALDAPFLSTRELFLFKLSLAAEEVERYLAMPEKKRRAYLDETLARRKATLEGAESWKEPRRIEQLEWFASATDLCNVMATLSERARQNPKASPLLDILAKNPGVPIDKATWPYAGFKGGSEPGVMNLTWLLRRNDGRTFVLALGFNDRAAAVDEGKVLWLATGVFDLLAKEGR